MKFTIPGQFKPYVRMTYNGKWVRQDAQEYLASKDRLAWEFRRQMNGAVPFEKTPLEVSIKITMTSRLHRQDLDNQTKAIVDAAQGVVFGNDAWIDRFEKISRQLGDEDRIEVEILAIEEN